jgi:hypothetical protein
MEATCQSDFMTQTETNGSGWGSKVRYINPLPLLFKSLLPGQEDCVFFSGHLNLHAKPET